MSNLTLYKNDEPRPEMDELLHDYFQAEAPTPWPGFQAPKSMRARETPSLWARFGGRMVLAACVTALIVGYWSLSGTMSSPQANGLQKVTPPIASKGK